MEATPRPEKTGSATLPEEPAEKEDCARAEIAAAWPADRLLAFVQDVERLLRINPHYEFSRFEWMDGEHHTQAHLEGINHANGLPFDVTMRIEHETDGLKLYWQGWLKPLTRIRILDEAPVGTRLVIEDDYSSLPREERERRKAEADTSLLAWAHALHRHLQWRPRLARIPGALAIHDRWWLGMKPSARRISAMLLIVTLAEFLVFAAVFTIFWLEWHS